MNFINRAIKNVTRKLSKTVLLTLTFFLIGNLVIIGLGIANASENAKILTRQKMRAVVTYELDYEKIWEYAETIEDEDELEKFYNDYPRIKLADVSELLKDERVKTANAIQNNMWYPEPNNTVDFVHLNNKAEEYMGNNGQSCWYEDGVEHCETYVEPQFFVKGNMFPNMIEFEDKEYTLVSGRFYSQEEINNGSYVCLISEALASTNGISLGDTIRFSVGNYGSSYDSQMGVEEDDYLVDLEVIGIYNHNSPITPDSSNYDYTYPYQNPDNMILMPSTSIYMASLAVSQKQFDYYASQETGNEYYEDPSNRPSADNMEKNIYLENVTLLLDDPLNVDKFVEDYEGSLTQFVKLDANNDEFNRLAKPLDTLSMYAGFIIRLVVINAIVIITLVTALTLKTREYEIGVLLSVGASKFKVIAQFFLELALVAILGFSLAVVSGSLIAKRIGYTVLDYQISTSDLENNNGGGYITYDFDPWNDDYTNEVTMEDLISEYEVTISPMIILEIYILGLGIVLVSVIIPSFMIMRYNPKKILMNQN